ncbi:MAG: hypothetical protein Q8Q06_01605 [bacterium]|nr:hypothetical protein [bacterium]
MITAKVIDVEESKEWTNGYGETPWVIRMHVVFDHNGKREYARLDYVLRRYLGYMTVEKREAIRNARPETVSVFSRKYVDPYSYNKWTIYSVRRAELEAWAKRAKTLLLANTPRIETKRSDSSTLSESEVTQTLASPGIPTSTIRPLTPLGSPSHPKKS